MSGIYSPRFFSCCIVTMSLITLSFQVSADDNKPAKDKTEKTCCPGWCCPAEHINDSIIDKGEKTKPEPIDACCPEKDHSKNEKTDKNRD